jgi:hypothetical protein
MKILEAIDRVLLQPKAMLAWAIGFALAFAIVHMLGWREFTTVLSGTIPTAASVSAASLKAAAYLATYFGTVLASPILLLAAGLNFLLRRCLCARSAA